MGIKEQNAHMLAGNWYDDLTTERVDAREEAVHRTNAYNASYGKPAAEREELLAALLGHAGKGAFFEPSFRCEFGFNISVGDDFYANFDCIMLDGGGITIGNNVLFGPRVSVYTTNHALDPADRALGACIAKPVVIGDNVWVGGGVTINPGVTIGSGSVIGSGSIVTKDVPPNTIAAGVPTRILREITPEDRVLGDWQGL